MRAAARIAVTAYDTGEEKNGNRTTDSSAWSIETDGSHVATVEASARIDVTASAKNVPNLSMVEPIAPVVRESDKRMRPPPCVPDTVSFDFAIPIYSLVPEMRLLRFSAVFTTAATFDNSALRQQSDAPMAEDSARYRYRWERITELATSAGDIWISPWFFWKPYGAIICVLRRHIRMTR